jgi:5'-AMP-activated protein kinase catalytic alpha subunit
LDSYNRIKIVDFGLSNIYEKNSFLKTACGSPCYAAPEMIAGVSYEGLKV